MAKQRFKAVPAVYLFLEKEGQLLLMGRYKTGYQDGKYMVPGGHVESGEPPSAAMIRETKEEIGIEIKKEDLQLVHVMYRPPHDESGEYIDFFFAATKWQGEPAILEPEKCNELRWFQLEKLPQNIPEYLVVAFNNYRSAKVYSEFGW